MASSVHKASGSNYIISKNNDYERSELAIVDDFFCHTVNKVDASGSLYTATI